MPEPRDRADAERAQIIDEAVVASRIRSIVEGSSQTLDARCIRALAERVAALGSLLAERAPADSDTARLAEEVREIAESIVDVQTAEGKTLLRAADVLAVLSRRPAAELVPSFACPRGHRHFAASPFCTVCGAGPVERVASVPPTRRGQT